MFALQSRRLRRRLSGTTPSSARRQSRERRLAEQTRAEGERLAKESRELKLKEKLLQQAKARRELANYEPWGKAGGGAPNQHGNRFGDLRAAGIYPEDELKGALSHERCTGWTTPRRRRTPLRLREDPQIYFADALRQTIDNDVRYKRTQKQQQAYRQILDNMVDTRRKAVNEEISRNIEYEQKMHTMNVPWGKPGPGGTVWRNPRSIGLNFSKSMGWTDNETFNKLKGDHKHFKKSSLTLPKVKRADDHCNGDRTTNKENLKLSNVEKLPDIRKQSHARGGQKDDQQDDDEESRSKNKKKLPSPKKNKFIKRLSNGERVVKMLPDDVNRKNGVVEKKLTPEAAVLHMTGGIELVPLLARRRRVGARTLPSSDITRPPEQMCQWRDMFDVDYLKELKHQMKVKFERNEETRRDSAEGVRIHHATWASLWGRPGHGAPQQRGRYARSNLAQLLYVPLDTKL